MPDEAACSMPRASRSPATIDSVPPTKPKSKAASQIARPSSVQTYHRHLRAFLNFSVAEGLLEKSPLRNVKPPRVPNDQVQPFSPEQVQALLSAAI